jgi:hypothetical protein
MTNTNREGRYTGPSLQADAAPKRQHKNDFVPVPAPVKLDKNQQAIIDLHVAGGIVAFGAWQTGTGNYKKARAVPTGAAVYMASDLPRGTMPTHVQAWFLTHPRAQRCVAIV